LISINPSGMVANTYLNMDLLKARSRTYTAAICAQMQGDSAHTSFSHSQGGNPGATKEPYHNIHAQQYLDRAQITTFAESGNSEHGVLVIENVGIHWCVALGVAFGISLTQLA
jgi:hypothetical protein